MSQAVTFGEFEPDPDGLRSLNEPSFREMDRGFALRTHLLHLIFNAEISKVSFPEVPEEIGRLLVSYPYRPGLQEIQQN